MNTKQFSRGLRVGVPISLGYLAVSFTLGITAKNAGLSAFQATLTSLLVNASAGQYAAFTMMAAQGGYWEIAILEAVTNARYILMSCALSQKLPAASKLWHRLVIGFNVNDEIFGMAIAEQGKLNPFYYFGMMTVAMPGWALGTFLGTSVGQRPAGQRGQRPERGAVRHVPGGDHPRLSEEQGDSGGGGGLHGRQLCPGVYPPVRLLGLGYPDHFAHCGDCRRGGAAVPGEGGGKGGGRPWSIMSISISPWWPW